MTIRAERRGVLHQSLDETRSALATQRKLLAEREADVAKLQDTLNDLENQSRKLGESHSTDRFALELETERLRRDLARAEEDLEKARRELNSREEKARERESMLDKLVSRSLLSSPLTDIVVSKAGRLTFRDLLFVLEYPAR